MLKNEQSNTVSVEYSPDQIYTKKQLMEMGFPFTLNGDIVTFNELEEHYQRNIEYRKQKLIDKACEWITQYIDIPYEVRMTEEGPIASDYINYAKKRLKYVEEVVNDFKKAMGNDYETLDSKRL